MEPNRQNWMFIPTDGPKSFFQQIVKPFINKRYSGFSFTPHNFDGNTYYGCIDGTFVCKSLGNFNHSILIDEEQFRRIVLEEIIEPNYEIY